MYFMSKNIGISGILRPNGNFISCSYGNHGNAASEIPKNESEYCIYLSSGMETLNDENVSIIYFNDKISKKQLKWFFKNFFKLDKTQKKQFLKYLFNKQS